MSRLASQAVAGYYPTPSHLLPAIAALAAFHVEDKRISFMDPCAGKGEAIYTLVDFLVPQDRRSHVKLYTCEMEETRHAELSRKCAFGERDKALHGDAFRVTFSKGSYDGISLLYLNPPYDLDRVHGRLEQKFLARFAPALMTGGVLIFLVPFHALKASAAFLATEFTDIRCFRFPTADFETYKQVVLVANKCEALQCPDPKVERKVLAWADNADRIPALPELEAMPKPLMVTPSREYYVGLEKWDMRPVDITGLMSKVAPWHYTQRSGGLARLPHVLPDVPLQDLMLRQYPVATPPRPAHIASGIASGIFNGSRIESEKAGLPSLLVKGVFDKEYKTIEEKTNKDGEVIGLLQVQAPKLVTTVLDLSKRTYHTLIAGTTGSSEVAKMGVGDLLQHYGASLMQVMETQCPILYDPRRPEDVFPLPSSPRTLFTAQGHATRAVVKLLGGPTVSPRARRHRAAILLGEIGSGKTTVALMSAKTIASRRMLVMCPPHLLQSWTDEIAAVRPDAEVRVLQSVTDIDDLAAYKSDRPVVAILSRETAKLGHGWQAVPDLCPACGQKVPTGVDLAKTRAQCEATQWVPTCKFSRWGVVLSRKAAFAAPGDFHLSHLRTRIETAHREALVAAKKKVTFTGLSDAFLDEVLDACVARRVGESSDSLSQAIVWLCALGPTVERISRVGQALMASTSSWNVTDTVRALLHLLPARSKEQGDVTALLQAQRPASYSYGGSPFASFDGEIKSLIENNGTARFLEMTIKYEKGKPVIDDKPISALRSLRLAAIGLQKSGTFEKTPPCGERLYQAIPEPRRYALANYISKRHANLFDMLVVDECFVAGTKVSGRPIEAIRVGDTVDSYDEKSKRLTRKKVTRLWVKKPTGLVRVTFSDGKSFVCTPNHPIFVNGEWKSAGALIPGGVVLTMMHEPSLGGRLQSVWQTGHFSWASGEGCQKEDLRILRQGVFGPLIGGYGPKQEAILDWELSSMRSPHPSGGTQGDRPSSEGVRVLFEEVCSYGSKCGNWTIERNSHATERPYILEAHEREQPNQRSRRNRENKGQAQGPYISGSGWEWATNNTSTSISGCTWLADRSGYRDISSSWEVPLPPSLLQGGCGQPYPQASDRSGRGVSQTQEVEVLGSAQDGNLTGTWVESVEVLEPGSDGTFGGVCPDGLVYNLEVEGTHTYFAEGVLVHNCHEYATDGSAQERSAHRLTSLGLPVILMTGTIMNGYAESLFTNMWALSPAFRAEFERKERSKFVDRYGYRKRLLQDRDADGKVVEFGSHTDRVEQTERVVGDSPGVLPLFLLRHLLPIAVTLHKADLAIDLPKCEQAQHRIVADSELFRRYRTLRDALVTQIKKDQFTERAGCLMGALTELPSYLDRATADVGNVDDGRYVVRYPDSVGGEVVAAMEPLDPSVILPKEAFMLDQIEAEIAAGRNVLVFAWHVNLLPRLARIISARIGETVPILHADKVSPAKRQEWINKEVVRKKRHVLVTNPVAIQTGLNNLVHFATEIWHENPACNPVIFRQAVGRIDRIGQKLETRVLVPVYENTLQIALYDLLMRKVAVSVSTDGLDPQSAMQAAGIGEDEYITGLSIGKQLWSMIGEGHYSAVA